MSCTDPYDELHRPQFHFSPKTGWTNDPNGLMFYGGEYHLFFQHNPTSVHWGNMTWGHAVSGDLVHWEEIDDAIRPDERGTIFSGSGVVDAANTAGFKTGGEDALVAIYTSAGDPFAQSIAYSNDRGRSWRKYAGNPVVGHIRASNRDPKVIWHGPSGRWVMALYLDGNDYVLLGSKDLRSWQKLSDVRMPETTECPDFFELPVDGDQANTKWVFWGGAGVYRLGRFDGTTFTPGTPSLRAESGPNGYAAQTFSDVPADDGRRIQISWMRGGKYPAMPFNQQMSFPVELTLRTIDAGMRLFREPVREIERLHEKAIDLSGRNLTPGEALVPETAHDLFDIRATIEPGLASAAGMRIRGIDLRYSALDRKVTYLGCDVPVSLVGGKLQLQVLVDRTSLELFVAGGRQSASFCFLPEACDVPLELYAEGGEAELESLVIHELRSAWKR